MVHSAPSQPSPQLKPILDWIVGSEQGDIDKMSGATSDDSYEHIVLPSVLGSEPKNKAAWFNTFKAGFATLFDPGKFETTIHEVFEAPGHVTLHMSAKGPTKSGKIFTNEYMAVFQVQKDASGIYKIVRVKEFMDSQAMVNWQKSQA